ncbi:hypothetical protein [Paenibacillus popilliae]|uniref:hypothetical protein n=1 Tax=Paenibacillus popilliae TaxID=78057 RepID=UPI00163C10EE|nr:hypothetical protein [Paenibacillus sp. SDF0028]
MKKKISALCASLLMASVLLMPSIANGFSDAKYQLVKAPAEKNVVMFGGGHDVEWPW